VQHGFQFLVRPEMAALQHLLDTAIVALDHAVGLQRFSWGRRIECSSKSALRSMAVTTATIPPSNRRRPGPEPVESHHPPPQGVHRRAVRSDRGAACPTRKIDTYFRHLYSTIRRVRPRLPVACGLGASDRVIIERARG
jgi:hypothetical protein